MLSQKIKVNSNLETLFNKEMETIKDTCTAYQNAVSKSNHTEKEIREGFWGLVDRTQIDLAGEVSILKYLYSIKGAKI